MWYLNHELIVSSSCSGGATGAVEEAAKMLMLMVTRTGMAITVVVAVSIMQHQL